MQYEVINDLHTVRDWIRWAASEFSRAELYFGHGTDNAWDEAVYLVLWSLSVPWEKLNEVADARLTRAEREALFALLRERVDKRVPAPYLTGTAYFAGLPFKVNPQVLIPRSPLAELIHAEFQPWLTQPPARILDLCTGSGCIGIACALALPDAQVDLSDVCKEALAVAADNVAMHDVAERVALLQADLFAGISDRYDLIISNPPYVDREDMHNLPAEYRQEPVLALASGEDGLDFTRRLLGQAADHLNAQGVLVVEVGNSAPALEQAYPHLPFTWLDFEHGGQGVFLLTREQLLEAKDLLA